MAKVFVDSVDSVVSDSIDGYLCLRPDCVRVYSPEHPSIKIVARKEIDRTKVAIVSGGGAGHEPAHVGFVAKGMLTCAVSGDVFASPHVVAIVTALKYVAGIDTEAGAAHGHDSAASNMVGSFPGIVLVVKNYTGDRLAFGLAAEIVRGLGVKVEIAYVADDAAVEGGPVTGRRGLAGTLFVHKIAGALAEQGHSLDEVAAYAKWVASHAFTMGASLTTCSIPGLMPSDRLSGHSTMELGLGIHGEPGARRLDSIPSATQIMHTLITTISDRVKEKYELRKSTPCIALLNNLGGVSQLEFGVCIRSMLSALQDGGLWDTRGVLAGSLMTSLDMKGISVSILVLDGTIDEVKLLSAMNSPHDCPAWPTTTTLTAPLQVAVRIEEQPSPATSGEPDSPFAVFVRSVVSKVCTTLETHEDNLNKLDGIAGDGDCGSTLASLARGIRAAVQSAMLEGSEPTIIASLFRVIASAISTAAGGTSGVLYAIIFQAAANQASSLQAVANPTQLVARSLQAGVDAAQRYAGATLGDRTMLDVLIPVATNLLDMVSAGAVQFSRLSEIAEDRAVATAAMAPRAGRASYVDPKETFGHEDPGARGAALWLHSTIEAIHDFKLI